MRADYGQLQRLDLKLKEGFCRNLSIFDCDAFALDVRILSISF